MLDCALDDLLCEKLSEMTRNPDFLNTLSEDQKAKISTRLRRAITMQGVHSRDIYIPVPPETGHRSVVIKK